MGGKAIPKAIRVGQKLYFERVIPEVFQKLDIVRKHLDFWSASIPAYRMKEDFGDLDVLIGYSGHYSDIVEKILDVFEPEEFKRNKQILSIGYPIDDDLFQVDFIVCPKTYFGSSLQYYSYNDLGNLIGRIAHRAGFKYGHRGLEYVLRDPEYPTRVWDTINVTSDLYKAMEFFGLDAWHCVKGFDTLEEIFQFVASSKYFHRDMFAYESLNHDNRVRNAKRSTYNAFLKWIDNQDDLNSFNWNQKESLRTQFLQEAKRNFPVFERRLAQSETLLMMNKEARKKFNADIVKELTGLEGKDLGNIMRDLNSWIDTESFKNGMTRDNFILNRLSFREIKTIVQSVTHRS